jgi:solute carrier family 25 protein 38
MHFFFLETIKPLFETRQPDGGASVGLLGALVVGGLSRTLAAVAACPFTIVKTRMEYSGAGAHAYRGTLHALSSIWRAEGLRGMYRGLGPTALSQAPFSALYYMFYTRLQVGLRGPAALEHARLVQAGWPAPRLLRASWWPVQAPPHPATHACLQDKLKATEMPSVGINFVSGTVAAVAATVLTQPADVIRTRMQLNLAAAGASAAAAAAPQTTHGIFRQILEQQGMRGLLSGAAPRVVKRTLQTALLWTLYEELYPALVRAGEAARASMESRTAQSSTPASSSTDIVESP